MEHIFFRRCEVLMISKPILILTKRILKINKLVTVKKIFKKRIISPPSGWAYIQLANVHDARNELEDAILCVQKAIEVQPDAVHYHKTLEKLLHKQESARAKVTQ